MSEWKHIRGRSGYTNDNPCRFPEAVRLAIGMNHWELIWAGGIVGVCVPQLKQRRRSNMKAAKDWVMTNSWVGYAMIKGEWKWIVSCSDERAIFPGVDMALGLRPTAWERIA